MEDRFGAQSIVPLAAQADIELVAGTGPLDASRECLMNVLVRIIRKTGQPLGGKNLHPHFSAIDIG